MEQTRRVRGIGVVTVYYEWVEGRIEPVGVRLERPLRTSILRDIPLTRLAQEFRKQYLGTDSATLSETASVQRIETKARRAAKARLRRLKEGRGRPRKLSEEFFAGVARVYIGAWERGDPPTRAVAKWNGGKRGEAPMSTAAKWVSRARHEFGYLGETTKGKPGGIPRGRKG
jgi:hypothetical protein